VIKVNDIEIGDTIRVRLKEGGVKEGVVKRWAAGYLYLKSEERTPSGFLKLPPVLW
jgi:hypothetical protein